MIIVDTNVISETMRPDPNPAVIAWLDAQAEQTLYLSTVSLAELLLGIAIMPPGRRKSALGAALNERALPLFGPRLLDFTEPAARAYADLISRTRAAGRPIGMADGQIAATAVAHGFMVASRDTGPYEAAGLRVINPWNSP
jgi:predicted nucleic acid-binding protein